MVFDCSSIRCTHHLRVMFGVLYDSPVLYESRLRGRQRQCLRLNSERFTRYVASGCREAQSLRQTTRTLFEEKDSQGDLANAASESAETVRCYVYFPDGTTLRGVTASKYLMNKSCGGCGVRSDGVTGNSRYSHPG